MKEGALRIRLTRARSIKQTNSFRRLCSLLRTTGATVSAGTDFNDAPLRGTVSPLRGTFRPKESFSLIQFAGSSTREGNFSPLHGKFVTRPLIGASLSLLFCSVPLLFSLLFHTRNPNRSGKSFCFGDRLSSHLGG